MNDEYRFWFVNAYVKDAADSVNLAVSAQTERSARVQARKALGPTFTIDEVHPITYAHAWVIDFFWSSKRHAVAMAADAIDPHVGSTGTPSTRVKEES